MFKKLKIKHSKKIKSFKNIKNFKNFKKIKNYKNFLKILEKLKILRFTLINNFEKKFKNCGKSKILKIVKNQKF